MGQILNDLLGVLRLPSTRLSSVEEKRKEDRIKKVTSLNRLSALSHQTLIFQGHVQTPRFAVHRVVLKTHVQRMDWSSRSVKRGGAKIFKKGPYYMH